MSRKISQENWKCRAAELNEILLEPVISAKTKVRVECGLCGHRWIVIASSIQQGYGCPRCAGNLPTSGNEWGKYAEMVNIEFTIPVVGALIRTPARCKSCGYEWDAIPMDIRQGHGCSKCHFKNESICHNLMEAIFGTKFKAHAGFPWLLNRRGNRMHLDGYGEKVGVAFEYNGEQHYAARRRFYWEGVKENDALKERLCTEHGITLIVIPCDVDPDEREQFILDRYQEKTGEMLSRVNFDWRSSCGYGQRYLKELQDLATAIGYKLISEQYLGAVENLEFECDTGHIFSMSPHAFKAGQKCPKCRELRCKYPIWERGKEMEGLREQASTNGYKLISEYYPGCNKKMEFECNRGHRFPMSPYNFRSGHRCPICYELRHRRVVQENE